MNFIFHNIHNFIYIWRTSIFISIIALSKRIFSEIKNTWLFLNGIFLKKIINYFRKPNLKISIKNQTVWLSKNNEEKKHYPYFCVSIINHAKKTLHLNLRDIYIGEYAFHGVKPDNFHDFDDCESKLCLEYQRKWTEIMNGGVIYKLEPYQTELLPRLPVSGTESAFTNPKKDNLLFFSKNKTTVSLIINGKRYDYGISKKIVYPALINYLAFYDKDIFEKKHKE